MLLSHEVENLAGNDGIFNDLPFEHICALHWGDELTNVGFDFVYKDF